MCKASQEGEHLSPANASRFSNEAGDRGCLRFKLVNFLKRLSSSVLMIAVQMSSFT